MSIPFLNRAASTRVEDYNPADVIAAVNALQPLGKEEALRRIDSFLESLGLEAYAHGLFWVLRVLFDLPAGQRFPPVVIGTPNIPAPADPEKLPRFPIVILRDIPFLVVRGYVLRGLPEPVDAHVRFFREHGVLRDRPLSPPASLEGIADEFSKLWTAAYAGAYAVEAMETFQRQLAKLEVGA